MVADDRRFDRQTLVCSRKLQKGRNRWDQFSRTAPSIGSGALQGPLLDFGCGAGYFLYEGLRRGFGLWGLDSRESKIRRYQHLIAYSGGPEHWRSRAVVATGEDIPFASNTFSAVCSWYVLEHIHNPGQVIREWVRVLQPGGLLVIKAQDARNGWEGHYKIPWPPFLSGSLSEAWLDVFGLKRTAEKDVVEVTQPQVECILETLGCIVKRRAPEPKDLFPGMNALDTVIQARDAAERIKRQIDTGTWRPQAENLFLWAIKPK
jgi:SAM-dependent methyltransferase